MRWRTLTLIAICCLPGGLQAGTPQAEPGHYRLSEGPDVAGELRIERDGSFGYVLAAGALDERARGRWERRGHEICLFTEPRPVPPRFSRDTASHEGEEQGEFPDQTLLVTWPDGSGIALIDFRLGLDDGSVIEGYTQDYGWSRDFGDERKPVWVELSLPMYGIQPARFELDGQQGAPWRFILTPNDFGVVDFQGACMRREGKAYLLRREGGEMRFVKARP